MRLIALPDTPFNDTAARAEQAGVRPHHPWNVTALPL